MPTPEQIVLSLMLPPGVLEWFDVIKGTGDHDQIHLVLEEKNVPLSVSENTACQQ